MIVVVVGVVVVGIVVYVDDVVDCYQHDDVASVEFSDVNIVWTFAVYVAAFFVAVAVVMMILAYLQHYWYW